MAIFALTGDFCCGKTTILNLLKKKGAFTFNIDKLVHKYYSDKNSIIYKKIKKNFPSVIVKNNISRKILKDLVFNDKKELVKLEKIVHPVVIEDLKEWIKKHRNKKISIAEVPLLFEKRLEKYFDGVIVVNVKRNILVSRIKKRFKLNTEDIKKRLKLYIPLKEKIKKSDFVIDNNGGIRELYREVDILWKRLNKGV